MAMSLVKTSDWVNWSGTPMKHAPLTVVGTAKHVLTLTFRGSTITTTYDGIALQVTDDGTYAPSAANTSGGITLETWSANAATAMTVSKVVVTPL
jgi:hypothetical protein